MKDSQILSAQIRAARSLLNWSQKDLSERSGISRNGIARFENGLCDVRLSTAEALKTPLQSAGINFIIGTDGSFGVSRSLCDTAPVGQ